MSVKVFFNYDAPFNESEQKHLTGLVNKWLKEIHEILPNLKPRDVVFDREPKNESWNTGGSSWTNKIVLNLKKHISKKNQMYLN